VEAAPALVGHGGGEAEIVLRDGDPILAIAASATVVSSYIRSSSCCLLLPLPARLFVALDAI
jgi:hypothetical protein